MASFGEVCPALKRLSLPALVQQAESALSGECAGTTPQALEPRTTRQFVASTVLPGGLEHRHRQDHFFNTCTTLRRPWSRVRLADVLPLLFCLEAWSTGI